VALTQRDISIPVHFIETDSPEVDATFPQMRPFLHGWGELLGFRDGRCDTFFAFRQGLEPLNSTIDYLFKRYAK
jgi:hypothetical protein